MVCTLLVIYHLVYLLVLWVLYLACAICYRTVSLFPGSGKNVNFWTNLIECARNPHTPGREPQREKKRKKKLNTRRESDLYRGIIFHLNASYS